MGRKEEMILKTTPILIENGKDLICLSLPFQRLKR